MLVAMEMYRVNVAWVLKTFVTKIDHDLFSFVSWLNGAGRKVLDEARLPWVYILNQDHLPLWA